MQQLDFPAQQSIPEAEADSEYAETEAERLEGWEYRQRLRRK